MWSNTINTPGVKPKTFDPNEMLLVIADTFAKHGYEGTSFELLTANTGLGKQSLYNTYGDKKNLVCKALKSAGRCSEAVTKLTDRSLTGRKRIEGFFDSIVEEATDAENPGCLVSNLLLEKGGTDVDVLKAASCRWNETRTAIESVIEGGIADGSIKTAIDPEIVGYALMNLLNGLRITARATNDATKIRKITRETLKALI